MNSEEFEMFWTSLFEENELTLQLHKLADEKKIPGCQYFISSHSGRMKLDVFRASALGDNFMSDTFIIETSTENDSKIEGFVKVIHTKAQ